MVNVENTNYWEESYEVGFSAWIEKHGYSKKTAQTYKSMFFAFIAREIASILLISCI